MERLYFVTLVTATTAHFGCAPTCSDIPLPTPPKACMASSEIATDRFANDVEVNATGTVTAVGTDEVPDDCFRRFSFVGSQGEPDNDTHGEWLQFDDGTERRTIAVRAGGATLPVQVGDPITVAYRITGGGFGPFVGDLLVTTEDRFLLYVASGADLPDVRPPNGLELARGKSICAESGTCLSSARFDIVAKSGAASVIVPYGEEATIDGSRITHGGYTEQTSSGSKCVDAYAADLHLMVRPDNGG